MARGTSLTADDWVAAALAALAERGLAAVAVEPLAVRLGATKGSFYWHFANRDALVQAVLERWEAGTERVIEWVDGRADGVARLRRLIAGVFTGTDPVEVQLLAAADQPVVGEVVRRVVARRTAYVASLFESAGLAPDEAAHRAALFYAAYVGHHQLTQRLPGAVPVDDAYREAAVRLALAGLPGAEVSAAGGPPGRSAGRPPG